MKRNQFMAKRLRELFLDGKWIANTNYKEQLESVNWQQATHKVASLNTIAALTFHVNYYLDGLLQVFRGGPLTISDQYSFDSPPILSEADWQALVATFLDNATAFIQHVENLPDTIFDETFVDVQYGDYWQNLQVVVEHSYYHLGQLTLLRKLIIEE